MKELAEKLNNFEGLTEGSEVLEEAAIKWAVFSLKTYNKELRQRALNVSSAIMDFIDELRMSGLGE